MLTDCRIGHSHTRTRAIHILSYLLLAIAFVAFGAAQSALAPVAHAEVDKEFAPIVKDTSANDAVLVLVVEFKDSPQDGFYDQTNFEKLTHSINSMGVDGSYRNYLYTISKGKLNTAAYFPQAYTDGTYLHIRVNMTAEEYLNGVEQAGNTYKNTDRELFEQITQQFNYARPHFDTGIFMDESASIKNMLVIIDLPESVEGFTSYSGNIANQALTFGMHTIGDFTIVSGGGTSSGADRFNASVAVHERLHALGAPYYYRDGISGEPVGVWDVMAKADSYSWPLAFTRQQIGWLDSIPEISPQNSGQSIPLYSSNVSDDTKSKPQAYKIKPSPSESEYFIVEYRKRNEAAGNGAFPGYDGQIPSSGLIVYRVNPAYAADGNTKGNDYVYVFRPGETGIGDAQGDISSAAIRAGSYGADDDSLGANHSIGSLDPNATVSDGAICYSNGKNTGILIEAIGQDSDSITFTLKTSSDYTSTSWNPVLNADGSNPFSDLGSPRSNIVTDGTNLYVLAEKRDTYSDSSLVYKYDGKNWISQGEIGTGIRNVDIDWFNGALYAAGVQGDASSAKTAKLRCLQGGSWKDVASVDIGEADGTPNLEVVDGTLYMLTSSIVSGASVTQVYKLDGSKLAQYGNALPIANPRNATIVSIGGKPAVIAGQTRDSGTGGSSTQSDTSLYRLEDASAAPETLMPNKAASTISATTMNGMTYVYVFGADGTLSSGREARLIEYDSSGTPTQNRVLEQAFDGTQGGDLVTDGRNLFLTIGTASRGTVSYKIAGGNADEITSLDDYVYLSSYEAESCIVGNRLYVAAVDSAAGTIAVCSYVIESSMPPDPPTPPQDISAAEVSSIPDQDYNGTKITPEMTVTLNGRTLVKDTDYTVSYSENVNPGPVTVTITGIGDYTGTKTTSFKIVNSVTNISNASVGKLSNQTYTGSAFTPKPEVKMGSTVLRLGTDYTLSYSDNTDAGTATVTITGKGSYQGTKKVVTFTIAPRNIGGASVSPIATQIYDGKVKTPKPTVKVNGKILRAGVDYDMIYSNHVNVGVATITFKGKGNYTGQTTTTFNIKREQTTTDTKPTETGGKSMYRLYNPNSGEHFYTADASERDNLKRVGWAYEGVGWTAPKSSKTPVYRLYSGTDHHYTMDASERDNLVRVGWKYEGIGWYSDDGKRVPLYRQFNPNVVPTAPTNNSGSHNYTKDLAEHNRLVAIGWKGEGVGWYGM